MYTRSPDGRRPRAALYSGSLGFFLVAGVFGLEPILVLEPKVVSWGTEAAPAGGFVGLGLSGDGRELGASVWAIIIDRFGGLSDLF